MVINFLIDLPCVNFAVYKDLKFGFGAQGEFVQW